MKNLICFLILTTFVSCGKSDEATITATSPIRGAKGDIELAGRGDLPDNWFTKDLDIDGVLGVSADLAYKNLDLEGPEEPIIVAVLDSGVQFDHEDLESRMWINKNEIPDNGIDDDDNGYIDDIHGWNFIGNDKGENIGSDSLEVTRILKRLMNKKEAGESLSAEEEDLFNTVQIEVNQGLKENEQGLKKILPDYLYLELWTDLLKEKLSLKTFNKEILSAVKSENKEIIEAKDGLLKLIEKHESLDRLGRTHDRYKTGVESWFNVDFNPRALVGDDPKKVIEKGYGNNNVQGPDARHGTHVAGIIAADRENSLGIKGVSKFTKIMSLRMVPNGDERDKDVINAIYYAVDNGAKIINMSFGKSYSPLKEEVDKAFQYAADHDVLIVHAAGNSNSNNDLGGNYPNQFKGIDNNVLIARPQISTWLEIGASTSTLDLDLPASFSNYGKKAVHLFAPGFKIYSTIPGNKYEALSGTSMACPTVSGVAALAWSQMPSMSAKQIKKILQKTAIDYQGTAVKLPGSDVQVPFLDLSEAGAVVNAFTATQMVLWIKE